jgi:poly-gamma-glutamate capsule biosynthesis protein CapA/YwtB (metallophosphatase superfamily)
VVVSVHWGSNWGYGVGPDQVRFAHRLIGGVDLIHGHSSHHPRPVEVFGGKLVLYGCGDCINDYVLTITKFPSQGPAAIR